MMSTGSGLPQLDPHTLFCAISAIAFVMAAIAASSTRATTRHRRAALWWASAMACAGVAFGLFFLRGHAPDLLTVSVGNLMALLVPGLALHANALLLEAPRAVKLNRTLLGCGAITVALHLPTTLNSASTVVVLCFLAMTAFAASACLILTHAVARRSLAMVVSGIVSVLAATAFAARGISGALDVDPIPMAPSGTLAGVGPLLLAALYVSGGSLGFMSMLHGRVQDEMHEVARRDALTGVLTRTAFMDAAAAASPTEGLTLAMVDLDHFKGINDAHGHQAGDHALSHAARAIGSAVRIGDVIGRYGGEEFCILLPGCTAADARPIVERVLDQARAVRVRCPDGREFGVTVSIGYAATGPVRSVEDARTRIERLVGRADAALYDAKRGGRDRALPAGPPDLAVRGPGPSGLPAPQAAQAGRA